MQLDVCVCVCVECTRESISFAFSSIIEHNGQRAVYGLFFFFNLKCDKENLHSLCVQVTQEVLYMALFLHPPPSLPSSIPCPASPPPLQSFLIAAVYIIGGAIYKLPIQCPQCFSVKQDIFILLDDFRSNKP